MKPNPLVPALVLACWSLPVRAAPAADSLVEFDPQEVRSLGWRVVDDGVMGGLSRGRMEVGEEGVLNFSGNLSLENNGGFSSLRTEPLERDLAAAEGLRLRVRGDGRTYQVRFSTEARYRGMEVSFMAEFPTEKGKWTEVRVPFERFTASFRGRQLEDVEFEPAKIRRIGLLLGDKQAGPFELEVDWIRTYGAGDGPPSDLAATAAGDGRLGTLAALLGEARLAGLLREQGPFTLFAPTDAAFDALPEGTLASLREPRNRGRLQAILKFHLLPTPTGLVEALEAGSAGTVLGEPVAIGFSEGRVRVNGAAILDADIRCSNGVIHVVDSVLLPPERANDLASVARRAGKFGTLLAAVDAAGLGEALAGEGPFTVFAPTDAAFEKLPAGTVEALLEPENREPLRQILMLHALAGRVSAGDALNRGQAEALSGATLRFGIEDGRLKVNGATLRKADIECDNGVIHVIDAVLLPASDERPEGDGDASVAPAPDPAERIAKG